MNTILILDDEAAVRSSFTDYFEDQMWRVIPASSAEDALKLLETEEVQAAIVDVRLPGMGGNDFIRRVLETTRNIALVICTGSPEYAIPNDFFEFDCVCRRVMKKPVSSFENLENMLLETMADIQENQKK